MSLAFPVSLSVSLSVFCPYSRPCSCEAVQCPLPCQCVCLCQCPWLCLCPGHVRDRIRIRISISVRDSVWIRACIRGSRCGGVHGRGPRPCLRPYIRVSVSVAMSMSMSVSLAVSLAMPRVMSASATISVSVPVYTWPCSCPCKCRCPSSRPCQCKQNCTTTVCFTYKLACLWNLHSYQLQQMQVIIARMQL